MWLRWSAQVAGNIADNLRTPLLMSQVSNAQRRTKRRLNAIGESPSDAVAANEPERVQALKQENERRGVQKMAKQQRKDDKAKKFLREQAIARSLFDDGIIDWTPDAAQSVEICKQIIKPQLVEFVRKHNLEGLMRRETGENLYSIRRAVLVEFLLKHLPENAHHDGEEGDSGQLEDMSCLDFEEELNSTDSEPDEGSETASQISELSVNSVEASSDHGAAMLKTPETVVTVRLAGEPCESTDVESRFSGPLTWPQLCELMSSNGLQCEEPPNTVEHLINKTVCFKWQIGLEEVGAWCIGTITNTCTRLGYNYLVKYIGETYENYHLLTCDGYCFEEHAPIGAWFLLSK